MHPSSSSSSTDSQHYQAHETTAAQKAAGETVPHETGQASRGPGAPPGMPALREKPSLTEDRGMEVDGVQDNSPLHGQKRKRGQSGDLPEQHSAPKFRRVNDDVQAAPASCTALPSETVMHLQEFPRGSCCVANRTPLHLAIYEENAEAVRSLLESGAKIDQPDADGEMPLHLAARNYCIEIMGLLLQAGAPVDQLNGNGDTPLHISAADGDDKAVDFLVKAGAEIDRPDAEGHMPLHIAVCGLNLEAVEVLLNAGAQVNQPDQEGNAALHFAAGRGFVGAARLLLERGAKIDAPNTNGKTPLHLAAKDGNDEVVRLLLEAGAKIDERDARGNTPLHLAARRNKVDEVNLLLNAHALVNVPNYLSETPLHRAARYGHARSVEALLKGGANIFGGNICGPRPLQLALDHGDIETVSSLLKAYTLCGGVNKDPTILEYAISRGNADHVRLILQARTEITYRRAAAGSSGLYEKMISAGSLLDDSLTNAINMTIAKEDVAMVELLLERWVLPVPKNLFLPMSPMSFRIEFATPLTFPIHDLFLCGPITAKATPAVPSELMSMLVSIFEACAAAQMTPKEMDDALRRAGLLSPVVDELAGQFYWASQLKQAMAGDLPLTQAQIRQAIGGMLAELEHCMVYRAQPYRAPERRTARNRYESHTGTPVPWLSKRGQEHLAGALARQVQTLAELGRKAESDELGEGISDLFATCLASMPVQSDANAAALRHTLTAKLGMYGSLADKTVAAWGATLAEGTATHASMLGTFAQQLQTHLSGAAIYSQVRSNSAVGEAEAQVVTQLMMRQWTMLEQYWKAAPIEVAQ